MTEAGRRLGVLSECPRCAHLLEHRGRNVALQTLVYIDNDLQQFNTLFAISVREGIKSVSGRTDGLVDVVFATQCDGRESLFGRRVDHIESVAAQRRNPGTVDVELLFVGHVRSLIFDYLALTVVDCQTYWRRDRVRMYTVLVVVKNARAALPCSRCMLLDPLIPPNGT